MRAKISRQEAKQVLAHRFNPILLENLDLTRYSWTKLLPPVLAVFGRLNVSLLNSLRNTTRKPSTISAKSQHFSNIGLTKVTVNLLAEDHSKAEKSGKHRIVLEGYGYRWYRVGGLDYLLRRTEIDEVQQANL